MGDRRQPCPDCGKRVSRGDTQAVQEPLLKEAIEKEVEHHNQYFGSWEQVKKIELTPEEWSIDEGHLTPTMKLKRKVVAEKYDALIEQMYS